MDIESSCYNGLETDKLFFKKLTAASNNDDVEGHTPMLLAYNDHDRIRHMRNFLRVYPLTKPRDDEKSMIMKKKNYLHKKISTFVSLLSWTIRTIKSD
ncbi:unnamed protein product [Lactuca virosa]|uniref:Uncharacterized protein n=1 Tax=Lactuca virosa TaxID=75947 RepID=A0AAU9MJK8_9ASTR|nr:unnamed protein product [Lactuca virosa]